MQTAPVVLATFVWFVIALLVGASGLLQALRPPAPQLVLLTLTALLLIAIIGIPRFRGWALTVDERLLVAFHLTRFVGIYFLLLYSRGELPYAFAVVGGWGDIVTAVLALGLLASGPASTFWRRRAYAVWNVLGLADILLVVLTAARSAMADPESMQALQRLPLSMLLTFVVPIIVVTHLVLGYRLGRDLLTWDRQDASRTR